MPGPVDIVPVSGLRDFLSFCSLPRKLYAGAEGFASSLDAERWTLYAHRLNPHYKRVEESKWLARRDGATVGRIAAQIYRDIEPVGASRAQFGALDCIEDADVLAALTRTAESWLAARGATVAHGPFSPSVNSECGLLVEGHTATPMIFMPWHPPYLARLLERQGYEKARDLVSYRYDVSDRDRTAAAPLQERAMLRENLTFRSLRMDDLDSEVALMTDLFNDAWSGNWGFAPIGRDEFKSMADSLKFVVTADYGFVVEIAGEPAAFGIIVPNLHEITRDMGGRLTPAGIARLVSRVRAKKFKSGRLALFGMRKALHRSARGGLILLTLIEELRLRSRRTHLDQIEFGWVLEDNAGMRKPIEMSGARIDKVHRIYEKRLNAA